MSTRRATKTAEGTAASRKRRGRKTVLLALAFLAVCRLAVPASAADKDYYFPEVKVEIRIDPDGSFTVEERRTFEFSGSFSWAELYIPLRVEREGRSYDVRITDFAVADDDGFPIISHADRSGDRFEAKWFYSAQDERRTFLIRYRVAGGIRVSDEVGEFYWQVIGDGWSKPTERAEVTVLLPEPLDSASDMLVYGHGPLSGRSEIVDGRTARFSAANIPAGQFLEIRVVWPAGLTEGVPAHGLTREGIKEEEARFVRETIERGIRAREAAARRSRIVRFWVFIWLAWLIAGPAIFLAFYIPHWKKTGRDYPVPGAPEYFREPPSALPPALVEHLRKEGGTATPRAFTATIFDLARRGFIRIEDRLVTKVTLLGSKEKTETLLNLRGLEPRAGEPALLPLESEVLEIIFNRVGGGARKGEAVTVDELKSWLKRNPTIFQRWFRGWVRSVKDEGKARGFIEPESVRLRNVFLLAVLPAGLLTANVPLFILALILIPKLLRRARPWAEENEKWEGLERFLRDFGEFKDLPPQSYVLWESYLVFGILFGQAKKIIRALPILLKDERTVSPAWYSGLRADGFHSLSGVSSIVNSIQSAAAAIEQASSSTAHYSSGGGGGFSGGGGGGGGGGGAG